MGPLAQMVYFADIARMLKGYHSTLWATSSRYGLSDNSHRRMIAHFGHPLEKLLSIKPPQITGYCITIPPHRPIGVSDLYCHWLGRANHIPHPPPLMYFYKQ
jgi:hypothetical protein